MSSLTTENLDLVRVQISRKSVLHRTDSERRADHKARREERLVEERVQFSRWTKAGRVVDPSYFPNLIPKDSWSPWEPKDSAKPAQRMGRIRRNGKFIGGHKLPGLKVHAVHSEDYHVKERTVVSRKAHWLPPKAVGAVGKGRQMPTKQVQVEYLVKNPRNNSVMRVKALETVEVELKTDYIEGKMKLPSNDLTVDQNRDIACSKSRRKWGQYRKARS